MIIQIGVNWGMGRACGDVWVTSYNLVYKEIFVSSKYSKYRLEIQRNMVSKCEK